MLTWHPMDDPPTLEGPVIVETKEGVFRVVISKDGWYEEQNGRKYSHQHNPYRVWAYIT